MTIKRFDPNTEVMSVYGDLWREPKIFNVISGGRNSFKSSFVALKLVSMLVHAMHDGVRTPKVVVIRKNAAYIRDSVFQKIQWALAKYGLLERFIVRTSPFKIVLDGGVGSTSTVKPILSG